MAAIIYQAAARFQRRTLDTAQRPSMSAPGIALAFRSITEAIKAHPRVAIPTSVDHFLATRLQVTSDHRYKLFLVDSRDLRRQLTDVVDLAKQLKRPVIIRIPVCGAEDRRSKCSYEVEVTGAMKNAQILDACAKFKSYELRQEQIFSETPLGRRLAMRKGTSGLALG